MKYILWDEGFLEKVENYSGNQLNRKEDVGRLINIVRECGEEEEFENLVFTAKYICGMIRIVKNEHDASNAGNMDLIKADLNENIKKGVENISNSCNVFRCTIIIVGAAGIIVAQSNDIKMVCGMFSAGLSFTGKKFLIRFCVRDQFELQITTTAGPGKRYGIDTDLV